MTLNPDDTLLNGQYRILALLGRGGYGFVYQARDSLLHKEVAIKELIPALVGDEVILKRFLTEARATMELAHERIVRTYNVFQEGGSYYIVMECMAGGSLEEHLRARGSLPVGEAVRIAADVCEGLSYAHARGVVHCDLKPANILFTTGDAGAGTKVADFGIAHVSEQMLTRSWMTPAGFAAGTLPYMSPEQADGVREDPRVDVYALGAVLYRMLTGRTYLAFDERETPGAQADNVHRIRSLQPDPPSVHKRRLPAWLDEVVLKALSKEPDNRYASAAELRAALAGQRATPAEQETAPLAPTPATATTTPAPAHRRRASQPGWFWPVAGGAGVLLVAVLVVLAVLIGGGGDGVATETAEPTQVAGMVEATVTLIPRPSHTPVPPTATASPTSTVQPTDTPRPTATRTPRPTSTPRATPTRTRAPTRTTAPTATATRKPVATRTPVPELLVTWQDFHYECQGYLEWTQGRPPHETVTGYRSFQALMVITNQTADSTLEPPWRPERWIVTDGQREWEETYTWQWGAEEGGAYDQPALGPGATASWTWLCYPLPEGAWVKAADFTAWGDTYRFEFPKPEPGEFNYHDCP